VVTVREQILQNIETLLKQETWVASVYRGMLAVDEALGKKYGYPLVVFWQNEETVIEGAFNEVRNKLTVIFEIYDKTSEDNRYVDIRANELIGLFSDFIYNNARWNGLANDTSIKENVIIYKEGSEKIFAVLFRVEIDYSYVRGRSDVRYGS